MGPIWASPCGGEEFQLEVITIMFGEPEFSNGSWNCVTPLGPWSLLGPSVEVEEEFESAQGSGKRFTLDDTITIIVPEESRPFRSVRFTGSAKAYRYRLASRPRKRM